MSIQTIIHEYKWANTATSLPISYKFNPQFSLLLKEDYNSIHFTLIRQMISLLFPVQILSNNVIFSAFHKNVSETIIMLRQILIILMNDRLCLFQIYPEKWYKYMYKASYLKMVKYASHIIPFNINKRINFL